MGDPKKQHKKYARPRTPFDKSRIDEEKSLIKKYGLKIKREIWHAESYIDRIRAQAKKLIVEPEKQKIFIDSLVRLGLIKTDATIDDVLALTKEKLFDRRLQTIVFKKGLAKTIRGARQFIVHKRIKIGNRIVSVPSYIVRKEEENKISIIKKSKKEKATEPILPTEKTKEEEKEIKEEKIEEKKEKNG